MNLDNIQLKSLTIYLPKAQTLVISDIHIGYEEALNKQGVLLPRIYFKHLYEKTKNLIKDLKIKKVILNGDITHEFTENSTTEWRHTIRFLDLFKGKEIILIKGNHDTFLKPIAVRRNLQVVDHYVQDDLLFIHGDKEINLKDIEKQHNQDIHTIIIGHEHPAITLKTDVRAETYKCFLIGTYKKRQLIVMPSYNEVTKGTNIFEGKRHSPFLPKNLDKFKVIIYGQDLYEFGTVKDIKKKINTE